MAKIGVFDSGVGGLTVLKKLLTYFPKESFLYLGDTARLPYGTKSPQTIRRYSEQVMNYLISRNVDAIVIACNSASTQVPEKEWNQIPVYNVIEPSAKRALELTRTEYIGVLGTRATIESRAYEKHIHALNPYTKVSSQACPLFVPLAEEGWIDDPITNLIVFRYLQPLLTSDLDTLILGCTHYPLLQNSIEKAIRSIGSAIQIVDSGTAVAETLKRDYASGRLRPGSADEERRIEILTTDNSTHTMEWAHEILEPHVTDAFETVNI